MFEASEMKFAMGNAVEILKKEADHMLPDCDHNGGGTYMCGYKA